MTSVEQQLAETMRRVASEQSGPDAATLTARAATQGRRLRRVRQAGFVTVVLVLAAAAMSAAVLLGPGGGPDVVQPATGGSPPGESAPTTGETSGSPTQPSSAGATPQVTSCANIPDSALPRDTSYDTSLDSERGLLTLNYSSAGNPNTTLVVAYAADRTCKRPSRIRDLIENALAASR